MKFIWTLFIILSGLALNEMPVQADELAVPPIFSDRMVVQRNKPFPIWGTGTAEGKVTVFFNGQTRTATVDQGGKWRVTFSAMNAGGPFTLMIRDETGGRLELGQILIGDVWLCAGQSNMNFMLANDRNGPVELAQLVSLRLREFRCAMPEGAQNPENRYHSRWNNAAPPQSSYFSAVGYFFAKRIQAEELVPIGIIVMSCGATRAETWMNPERLKDYPDLEPLMKFWEGRMDGDLYSQPGKFFQDVVEPVAPFPIRGVIWYQGESNTLPDKSGRSIKDRAEEYKSLLKGVISSWRSAWGETNLPFCIIQLPNYVFPAQDIQWARIRQAQLEVSREVPNTGLVVTLDCGSIGNIHPNNKQPVGERAALWALAREYGKNKLVYSGPIIQAANVRSNVVALSFEEIGSGLTNAMGLPLQEFELADVTAPDIFVPSTAVIRWDEVIVSALGVKKPYAVRYAWSDSPNVTLFNKEGFPASSFVITVKTNHLNNSLDKIIGVTK